MRSLSVILASVALLCSTAALFSRVTWGEPIGVDSLGPPPVQGKVAVQEEVRAKKFVLVNEEGTSTAALGSVEGQPGLVLYDHNNKRRALIALDKDGQPGILLLDANGRIRAQFDIEGNEPRLVLLDENRKATFQAPQ